MYLIRRLPLWFRFTVAFLVSAAIFAAVVIYVDDHQQQASGAPAAADAKQAAQEEEQEEVLLSQEQSPQVLPLRAGVLPVAAVGAAVTHFISGQITDGVVSGPLDGGAVCTSAGGTSARRLYSCIVTAGRGSGNVLRYPFRAVAVPAARTITFCEVETPPYPDPAVPLSSACL